MALEKVKVLMNNDVIVSYKHLQALYEQRAELLEALKGMCDLYNTDEGTRSLPQYISACAAITNVEATQ